METSTVAEIRNKQFPGFPLSEPFRTLLGDIWTGFQILIWGPKGQGKSTFSLLLLAALSPWAHVTERRLWYMSGEEGIGAGLQKRVERTGLADPAFDDMILSGYKPMSREDLQDEILRRDVGWIVVDSVETLGFSGHEEYLFLDWARNHDVGVILIAHALKNGHDYKGDSALAHWVDAVVHIYREDGVHYAQTQKSRALDRNPKRVKLPGRVAAFGPGLGPEGVIRVARENGMCTNWDQKDPEIQAKCKAIFASLTESGEKTWEPTNGEADEDAEQDAEIDEETQAETDDEPGGDGAADDVPDFSAMSTAELMESMMQMMQD